MLSDRELFEIIRDFRSSDWNAVTLVHDELEIALTKRSPGDPVRTAPAPSPAPVAVPSGAGGVGSPQPAAPEPPTPADADERAPRSETAGSDQLVTAETVGIFWVAPAPGAAPFVTAGDVVEVGQQVGIVEVMKLMTNVTATAAGRVVEVLAENGESVEAGQPLVRIAAADGAH